MIKMNQSAREKLGSYCKKKDFNIISRGWLVERLIIWRYIHPARAWLLSSPSLPSRQVNMADSC